MKIVVFYVSPCYLVKWRVEDSELAFPENKIITLSAKNFGSNPYI